jgi:predicted peptidase
MRLFTRLITLLLLAPTLVVAQRVETGFLDRTTTMSGTVHRYQVYLPAAYAGSTRRWPVILFLHGAGERGSDGLLQTNVGLPSAIRNAPAHYPAIVIIPQLSTDSLWLGTSAQAAMAALDQTLAEFRGDPDRVYLTGLSMGGNGTWNLAYQFPERFAAIAPVCGFITPIPGLGASRAIVAADSGDAFAVIARRLRQMPTWIFHGEVDPAVPVTESRRAAEAFKAAGGNVHYTEFLGGGHNVWDGVYASLQFQEWLFAQHREAR